MATHPIIQQNDWAILTLPSNSHKVIEIRPDGIVCLGKFGTFKTDSIVGYAYGQSFEILDDKTVQPLESISYGLAEVTESRDATPMEFESSENNKELNDHGGGVQRLTSEEIEQMKKGGNGNEVANTIIENLIQSHDAFDKKTIYSQAKYLTRKQRKFTRRFTVEYLTASNYASHMHLERDPAKMLDLSDGTLGAIMSYANVMPGGTYLVMDETGGMIVYAMLERMQGEGRIVLLHENDQPKMSLLTRTNYSVEEIEKMVKPVNLLQFTEPEESRPYDGSLPDEEVEALPKMRRQRYDRRRAKNVELNESLDLIEQCAFDGLIYVSTLNPTTFVPQIIKRIKGSRPLTIYSPFKETLLPLNQFFLRDSHVLLPNMIEIRVRHFQTIPGRIHPVMRSRSGGGYILTGITVIPVEGAVACGRGAKKRKAIDI